MKTINNWACFLVLFKNTKNEHVILRAHLLFHFLDYSLNHLKLVSLNQNKS